MKSQKSELAWEARQGEFEELVVAVQAWRTHDEEGTWQPGMTSLAVTSRLSTVGGPVELLVFVFNRARKVS